MHNCCFCCRSPPPPLPLLQGFAELEYGILRWMGAVDATTPVITTVHDCQVLEEDIPPGRMLEHDVPVDIIVTPTRVRGTGGGRARHSVWMVRC